MLNYITLQPEFIERQIVESPEYWWSHKLDGHYVRIEIKNDTTTFFTKSNRQLSLPHIVPEIGLSDVTLHGELVISNQQTSTNAEVGALLRNNPENLMISVFAASINNQILPISQFDSTSILGKSIQKIKWNKVTSRSDIRGAFDGYTKIGGEGIVVMLDSGFVYKIKPLKTIDLVIIGYSLGVGENAGNLRDLLFGVSENENTYNLVGRTSAGINSSNSIAVLKQLVPLAVVSDYLEVSSAKTAFTFVKPKVIAQCTCLDVQGNNTNGIIEKPSLSYSDSDGYKFVKKSKSVSIYSMVFDSIRDDKTPSIELTGWNQLSQYLDTDEISLSENLVNSTIELREVYTKESKNGLAVRKLILLKTNKEQSGKYAAYNSFYSDYSPGRKSPLDTEIYLHSTKEEGLQKINLLREEYIKKGWIKAN